MPMMFCQDLHLLQKSPNWLKNGFLSKKRDEMFEHIKTIPEFNDPVEELSEFSRLSLIKSLVFVFVDSGNKDYG